jgi:hypothetical protein
MKGNLKMTKSQRTREINKNDITYDPTYEGHPINTDKEKRGCNKKILEKSLALFDHAINKHNKIFYMRMDVRFPENKENINTDNNQKENINTDNNQFESFMNSFTKNLKSKKYDPKYLWVREQSREKHQHYHLSLLLNGNITQNITNHIKTAEKLWAKRLEIEIDNNKNNGLIEDCTEGRNGNKQQNGIMIKRNSDDFNEAFDKCFEWNSYLAKISTKGYAPKNKKEYGSSQIPKKR